MYRALKRVEVCDGKKVGLETRSRARNPRDLQVGRSDDPFPFLALWLLSLSDVAPIADDPGNGAFDMTCQRHGSTRSDGADARSPRVRKGLALLSGHVGTVLLV